MGLIMIHPNGFADDHTVQINFVQMIKELDTIKKLEKSLKDISKWMCLNRLKMDPSKTEFSLFDSRHQIAKCTVSSINLVGEEIARSYLVRYQGLWLDHHLILMITLPTSAKLLC